MHINNPYAQAGWYNPQNPQTINTERSGNTHAVQPSIFGALPYPFEPSMGAPQRLAFRFIYSSGTILHSGIYGPSSTKYIDVVTDFNRLPSTTLLCKPDGSCLGVIEWHQRPTVEIPGILPKQYIAQWLGLSRDKSSRLMQAKGIKYIWTPVGDAVNLHPYNLPPNQSLLQIHRRRSGTITLEMSTEAVQAGLLEMAIVATVILQSGRNID